MPNLGGKKQKKRKNCLKKLEAPKETDANIVFRDETGDQDYCKVLRMLGDARFEGVCTDGERINVRIRGNMTGRRKIWINVGDIVLISKRNFENKADVILRYNEPEIQKLQKMGLLKFGNDNLISFTAPTTAVTLEDTTSAADEATDDEDWFSESDRLDIDAI